MVRFAGVLSIGLVVGSSHSGVDVIAIEERIERLERDVRGLDITRLPQGLQIPGLTLHVIDAEPQPAGRYEVLMAFEGIEELPGSAHRVIAGELRATVDDHNRFGNWRVVNRSAREVAAPAFAERIRLAPARSSLHEEMILAALTENQPLPEHFELVSLERHPGISVADVDGDGLDDIYVTVRQGRNLFFHNRGGAFVERAKELGLDIEGPSSSALFADFDNDGDADLFVGMSLGPSLYLENRRGRFAPCADCLGTTAHFVTSASTADFDNDGRLDLYLATYWADGVRAVTDLLRLYQLAPNLNRDAHGDRPWRALPASLSEPDQKALHAAMMSDGYHANVDRPGPPNVLLRNIGQGRFQPVRQTALRLFRNSFQCAWSDYDNDGDPDVYCANDFAPNNLFRNDGGRFTDVTAQAGVGDERIASMSVGWGDYDGDGHIDLYVSNMRSKAGRRIMGRLPGIDRRLPAMAEGNSLFRNTGRGTFERASAGAEIGGWSWGGQFVDFDNDGDLDIYAPNGFFTPPARVAIPVDN